MSLYISVPPSEVEILTQSGNALEDERYNEGTDLSLACSVLGGNLLCIDQINSPQKKKCYWNLFTVSGPPTHTFERSNLESEDIKIDLQGLSQTAARQDVWQCFLVTGRPRPSVTWLLNNQSLASRYSQDLVMEDGHVRQKSDKVACWPLICFPKDVLC